MKHFQVLRMCGSKHFLDTTILSPHSPGHSASKATHCGFTAQTAGVQIQTQSHRVGPRGSYGAFLVSVSQTVKYYLGDLCWDLNEVQYKGHRTELSVEKARRK